MGKTCKVVVCGTKACGKTAILEQLIYSNITKKSVLHSTIEDIYVAYVETDRGTKEKIRFFDTEGLTLQNKELPRQYLSYADAYILVCDPKKPYSLQLIDIIKKDIDKNREKKDVTIVVLANHFVSDSPRKVDMSQWQAWSAREKVKFYEVNAMDRTSLFDPFVYLSTKLNPPPTKSSFPPLGMVRKPKE